MAATGHVMPFLHGIGQENDHGAGHRLRQGTESAPVYAE